MSEENTQAPVSADNTASIINPTVADNATVQVPSAQESVNTTAPEAPGTIQDSPELNSLVSENLYAQSNIKDFKSVDDLATSYINLQRMVGNSVRIPPADATPEARAEFYDKIKEVEGIAILSEDNRAELYNKLGRPEEAAGYKFEDVLTDDIINAAPDITGLVDDFKVTAHELGLTNDQAKALVDMQLKSRLQQEDQWNAKAQEGADTIKKMWGDDYEVRLAAANQVANIYKEKYGDAMGNLLNGSSCNNPVVLDMLAELHSVYAEKGHAGVQKAQFGTTPEEALGKIADKKADIGFMKAYNDDRHPSHKNSVDELHKLYRIAHGA